MSTHFSCGTGELGEGEKFVLKCSVCDRVWIVMMLPPDGGMVHQDFQMPIVPCHADGLVVEGAEEKGFDRVVRLLTEGPTKSNGKKFTYTLNMSDGMIVGFSVARG